MSIDTSPAVRLVLLGQVAVEGSDGSFRSLSTTAANLAGALATAPGHFLSVAGLAEEVWPEQPPRHPKAALQTVVSRLRAHCRSGLLRSTPGGYGLDLDGGAIDLDLAGTLLTEARGELVAGAPEDAVRLSDRALSLWRGEPGTGLTNPALAAEISDRAAVVHRQLAVVRAEATLASGRTVEAVDLLAALARDEPYDDPVLLLRLRALSAAGRTTQAIEAFGEYRARLADDLGIDPGPEIISFHEVLLRQEAPLASVGPRRVGLRAQADTLFGRDEDVTTIDGLLHDARLVTLTGIGGIGKTRLAHAVAARAAERIPAVVVVELARARSADDVTRALTSALDVLPGRSAEDGIPAATRTAVLEALAEHGTLLVLDNCEQVAEPVASWVDAVLAGVAAARVLATGRAPLRVAGEHVYELGPLPATATDGPGPAAQLFQARASAVRPGLVLDEQAVARLCARLEGIPLGIELAAARARSLTVQEIEAALDDRFALLRTPDPTTSSRHRALHDVVEWSWTLLTDRQRLLARRSAVLPDGFDGRAAAFLVDGGSTIDLIDDLDALVAHSLLRTEEDVATGTMRYRMYETIREFALLRAAAAGEEDLIRAGAARWCQDFAVSCLREAVGPGQTHTFRRVALERENVWTVLRSAHVSGDGDTMLAAGVVLALFAMVRFDFDEMGIVLGMVTGAIRGHRTPPELATAHLWFRILAAGYATIFGTARDIAVTQLELRRVHHEDPAPGPAADALATTMLAARNPSLFAAQVDVCASASDPGARRIGVVFQAYLAENDGRLEDADAAGQVAYRIATEEGDIWTAAYAAQLLAGVHAQWRRPAETIAWSTRAATGFAALGVEAPLAPLARHVACAALLADDLPAAQATFATFLDAEHPAADGALFGRAGLAEVALARAAAQGTEPSGPLADYRATVMAADWSRPDTVMWLMLLSSSCVAQHVLTGSTERRSLDDLATRLCAHVVAVHRSRLDRTDLPLLGAVAGAMALWTAARDAPGDRDRAARLLASTGPMRSRQDLPALDRDRIRREVESLLGGPVPGSGDDADPGATHGEAQDPAAMIGEVLRLLDELAGTN